MEIYLTQTQYKDLYETLAVGGEVIFRGGGQKLLTWSLKESEHENSIPGKPSAELRSTLSRDKNFMVKVKAEYKKQNL